MLKMHATEKDENDTQNGPETDEIGTDPEEDSASSADSDPEVDPARTAALPEAGPPGLVPHA
jgi:hypothetical protein